MKNFHHKELDTTYLPKRDDETYSDIENFQDYELKNNLIFELVLRTKQYADLQDMKRYEKIKAAKSLGFSIDNAKYAGLPWMLLKLMIQKDYIDKKGQVFDIKIFFSNLLYQYKNDDNQIKKIAYDIEEIYSYYTEDEEYPLKELLNYYSVEDEYIMKNIIDGYYKIVDYYISTFENSIEYRKDIENDFHDFISFYTKNLKYSSKEILSSIARKNENIALNVLSEYKRKDKLTLSDIEDGRSKLIGYFVDNKKVYTIKGALVISTAKQTILKHQDKCIVIFVEDSKGSKEHYLLLLSESEKMFGNSEEANKANKIMSDIRSFRFKTYKKINMLSVLDDCLPLVYMNRFLLSLETTDIKTASDDITLLFIRPKLKLERNKIVSVKVDMSLSVKEIVAYITKIKKDYDDNDEVFKSISDLFNDNQDVDDTVKFKKNMRDSFFCYDYYSTRLKLTSVHNNNETAQKINDEIEQIKKSDQYKPKERKEQISKLDKQLLEDNLLQAPKPTVGKETKNFVFKESEFKKSKITSATAQRYYNQICQYIKKLGYEKNIEN